MKRKRCRNLVEIVQGAEVEGGAELVAALLEDQHGVEGEMDYALLPGEE